MSSLENPLTKRGKMLLLKNRMKIKKEKERYLNHNILQQPHRLPWSAALTRGCIHAAENYEICGTGGQLALSTSIIVIVYVRHYADGDGGSNAAPGILRGLSQIRGNRQIMSHVPVTLIS